jgi:hypothetical protein
MARTRQTSMRIPVALESAARSATPELAGAGLSTLVRAGLAMLAGAQRDRALDVALSRIGRQPGGSRGGGFTP